jgi:DNA-binding transcriptional ArsR family regulator
MPNNKNMTVDEFAEIFKALSNANRLRIFIRLASCCKPGTVGFMDEGATAYIGELGADINVVKSTLSHHIKELRRVGLIRTERQGQKIACWIDPHMVAALHRFFAF